MILLLDIGNSSLHMGLTRSGIEIRGSGLRYPTPEIFWHQTVPAWTPKLKLEHATGAAKKDAITGAVIASVAPQLTPVFANLVRRELGCEPVILDHRTKIGMKLDYYPKSSLGADRIANAVAACHLHPGNTIVVDMGTATTLEVVTKDKGFIGGMIMPGLNMMLNSLSIGTGQLPAVKLRPWRYAMATNTQAGMLSGVFEAHFGGINAAIADITTDTERRYQIVVTGGLSSRFARHITDVSVVDPLLTLRGLSIVFDLNRD